MRGNCVGNSKKRHDNSHNSNKRNARSSNSPNNHHSSNCNDNKDRLSRNSSCYKNSNISNSNTCGSRLASVDRADGRAALTWPPKPGLPAVQGCLS